MDLKDIKEFIALAKEEGVQELKYETDKMKMSVAFASSGSYVVETMPTQRQVSTKTPVEPTTSSEFHEIKSPFVGTFYSSAAPGEPAFVKPGDRVRKGQVLCILEAMKIMNEIESEVDGELVEVCLNNESLVEYGEVIFKIRT